MLKIRNIIAHSAFGPDERTRADSDGHIPGVYFDYLGRGGNVAFSERVRALVGGELDDSFISYDALSDLGRRMENLTEQFRQLAGSCAPLSDDDFDEETLMRMREALDRNVIPFVPRPEAT